MVSYKPNYDYKFKISTVGLQCPQKRSCGNQLIHNPETKPIGRAGVKVSDYPGFRLPPGNLKPENGQKIGRDQPLYQYLKKGDARSCDNYRTIALISHTSKILLKKIHKRMESTIERELSDNQAGFRKARGTRDHIANMRWIMERQLEYRKEVHICFIDYSKAFDCINHKLLWKTLLEMGIPKHLIQLLNPIPTEKNFQPTPSRPHIFGINWGETKKIERVISLLVFDL